MGCGGGWTRWFHHGCTAGTFPSGVSRGLGSGRYLRSRHWVSMHTNLHLPCPRHGPQQKLGEPCPLSPAVSPEQQHTASHHGVGQQCANGHGVNQGFQVEEKGQESWGEEEPFQPLSRAVSAAVPTSVHTLLTPTATEPQWTGDALVTSTKHPVTFLAVQRGWDTTEAKRSSHSVRRSVSG